MHRNSIKLYMGILYFPMEVAFFNVVSIPFKNLNMEKIPKKKLIIISFIKNAKYLLLQQEMESKFLFNHHTKSES